MKKRVVIWGVGDTARDFLSKGGFYRDYEILAFTDNNQKEWQNMIRGIRVTDPLELLKLSYDYVIICSVYEKDIRKQLVEQLLVEPSKIVSCFELEEAVRNNVVEKYASVTDQEIQETVSYFRNKGLNVYGSYEAVKKQYFVYRDQEDHPYIMFENKRMYFPDTCRFLKADGKEFAGDILYEQQSGSPHQYVRNEEEIKQGSVIVDAGVCEGNFALRYIDKAKKIYLIESDKEWMQALRRTFWPYRDRVVFCQKFLTRYNSSNTITIDSLVQEKVDFIKMDIEGAEIDALLGARKTLLQSSAGCAICSYHKQNDEENIRFILESYGYKTSVSKGYMFFVYDEDIMDTLDLRKGVVYGEKESGHEKRQALHLSCI